MIFRKARADALFLDTLDIWFEVLDGFDEFVFTDPGAKADVPESKTTD